MCWMQKKFDDLKTFWGHALCICNYFYISNFHKPKYISILIYKTTGTLSAKFFLDIREIFCFSIVIFIQSGYLYNQFNLFLWIPCSVSLDNKMYIRKMSWLLQAIDKFNLRNIYIKYTLKFESRLLYCLHKRKKYIQEKTLPKFALSTRYFVCSFNTCVINVCTKTQKDLRRYDLYHRDEKQEEASEYILNRAHYQLEVNEKLILQNLKGKSFPPFFRYDIKYFSIESILM